MNVENLIKRAKLIEAIRKWFSDESFTEIVTPIRITAPAPEPHIDCPRSSHAFLRASPELQMKKVISRGLDKIYQIGPCFREGERGSKHNPEFTMLEWYRAGADYEKILQDTIALIRYAAKTSTGTGKLLYRNNEIDLLLPWEQMSVRDAYLKWAGWDPIPDFDQDRFDEDMALKIEPSIPIDRPFILRDYPKAAASLSRLSPSDNRVAERWELYLGGVEIANAYSELTDGEEQRRRFIEAREERRRIGEDDYPLDEEFLTILESGRFPQCGGIAVGIDRLAMIFCNAEKIDDVLIGE